METLSALPSSDPTPLPPRDPRIRFWKVGGLVATFVLTFIVGNFFIAPDRAVSRQMLGHDFLAFYFGGTVARTGQFGLLYNLDATKAFEFSTGHAADLELGPSFGPWWNPPFAAWLFAPLSALPYPTALSVWWSFGMVCLGVSIWLMCRMLSGGWKTKLLVPLFMLTSMPFFQAFSHGQNTFFSLLLLTTVVTLWRARQSFWAGLICGLLFYKPQLGVVVALVLCFSQGRRALLGVTITGTALALVNAFTMPGTIHDFIFQMPVNLHWMQEENHYRWERHDTFKAFWRLTIQGWATGPTALSAKVLWGICEAALLGGLARAAWKLKQLPQSASRTDRLISAAIVSMPLLMPFYFDYDLLLISVGIAVYAADRQRTWNPWNASQLPSEERWLPRVWLMLFVTVEFSTILAGHTRVHVMVPLLTLAAVLLIRRATQTAQAANILSKPAEPIQIPAIAA